MENSSVYKLIELTGTSPNSIEDAVQNAVSRSGESIRNMRWFKVVETRGTIENGKIGEWQVTVKIGFHLEFSVTRVRSYLFIQALASPAGAFSYFANGEGRF